MGQGIIPNFITILSRLPDFSFNGNENVNSDSKRGKEFFFSNSAATFSARVTWGQDRPSNSQFHPFIG